MKKTVALFCALLCVACTISGCAKKESNISGSLTEIMEKIYSDLPDEQTPMMLETREITDEDKEYYLGTKDINYIEAVASEPVISSIAHSVILIRLEDANNAETVKSTLKESLDPKKWVCVCAEETVIKSRGDLVFVAMSDKETADLLEKSFDKL